MDFLSNFDPRTRSLLLSLLQPHSNPKDILDQLLQTPEIFPKLTEYLIMSKCPERRFWLLLQQSFRNQQVKQQVQQVQNKLFNIVCDETVLQFQLSLLVNCESINTKTKVLIVKSFLLIPTRFILFELKFRNMNLALRVLGAKTPTEWKEKTGFCSLCAQNNLINCEQKVESKIVLEDENVCDLELNQEEKEKLVEVFQLLADNQMPKCKCMFYDYIYLENCRSRKITPDEEIVKSAFSSQNVQSQIFRSAKMNISGWEVNELSRYFPLQIQILAFQNTKIQKKWVEKVVDIYAQSSCQMAYDCIIELTKMGLQSDEELAISILKEIIKHNQSMQVLRIQVAYFQLFKNKYQILESVEKQVDEIDEKIFVQNGLQLAGGQVNIDEDQSFDELSAISIERLGQIQVNNKKPIQYNLLIHIFKVQNAGKILQQAIIEPFQIEVFKQEQFSSLQYLSQFMDHEQITALMKLAFWEPSPVIKTIISRFLRIASNQEQVNILKYYIENMKQHITFDIDMHANYGDFCLLLGSLINKFQKQVYLNEIESTLPNIIITTDSIKNHIFSNAKDVTKLFMYLPIILAICFNQPDYDNDFFHQIFLTITQLTAFANQRPDDEIVKNDEVKQQISNQFDPVIYRCLTSAIRFHESSKQNSDDLNSFLPTPIFPTQATCILNEQCELDQFLMSSLLQYIKLFYVIQNERLNNFGANFDQSFTPREQNIFSSLLSYITTVNAMPTQEYLIKQLNPKAVQQSHFSRLIFEKVRQDCENNINQFTLRRKSQNIRNVFEVLIAHDRETQSKLQKLVGEIVNGSLNPVQYVQILNLAEGAPGALKIDCLFGLLQFVDMKDWNLQNSINGIIQKYNFMRSNQDMQIESGQLDQLLQMENLGDRGEILRFIILKQVDYLTFSDDEKKRMREFIKHVAEERVRMQEKFQDYRNFQFEILRGKILEKMEM